MKWIPCQDRCLADELLAVYQRCTNEGCPAAAEHVMQALEELAQERPRVQETVDRAYLWALRGTRSPASGADCGVDPPRALTCRRCSHLLSPHFRRLIACFEASGRRR